MDLKNKPGKASTGYMTSLTATKHRLYFPVSIRRSLISGTVTRVRSCVCRIYGNAQPADRSILQRIHGYCRDPFHGDGTVCLSYAEKFFGEQADKYRFAHLQDALTFVPFGVAVDEFQHICYSNPDMTPKERHLHGRN